MKKLRHWSPDHWLLSALIFLAPSNLFYILNRSVAYSDGLFSDYLLLRIFALDVLLLGCTLFLVVGKWQQLAKFLQIGWHSKVAQGAAVFWILLGLAQLLATQPLLGLLHWVRLSCWLLCGWYFWQQRDTARSSSLVAGSIVATLVFQSLVGIWQYLTHTSLGGYWLLGEPNLTASIGLAQSVLRESLVVLPYGTTAHPNVLSGVLAVYLVVLWRLRAVVPKAIFYTTTLLAGSALLLTESLSALLIVWFAVLLPLLSWLRPRWQSKQAVLAASLLVSTLITVPISLAVARPKISQPSVYRRAYLQKQALQITAEQPVLGTGLGQFTRSIERKTLTHEPVAFLQPVHHTGLLWLAEAGILGVLSVILAVKALSTDTRRKLLIALLPLAPVLALDHYLLTQPVGAVLIVLLIMTAE